MNDDVAAFRDLGWPDVDAVVVLGSGWAPLVESWPAPTYRATYAEAGLRPPVAPGHAGEVSIVDSEGFRILVLSGRTHLYEGHGPVEVGRNVRIAAALGAKVCVLTNANGSLFKDWPLGTIVALTDHINLSGTSPLVGANFVDLTDLYDRELRAAVVENSKAAGIDLEQGVYAMFPGPYYETASEAKMAAIMGADVVGMSTVLEAIAVRASGIKLMALSTVTAHEASGETIDPDEVVAVAERAAAALGQPVLTTITNALQKEAR